MTEEAVDLRGTVDGPPVYRRDDGVVIIRASAMGMCTRAMVALFQGLEKMLPPDSMQARFDDGHLHEGSTLATMEEREAVAIHPYGQTVRYVVIPGKVEIHGHVDGVVTPLGKQPTADDIYAVAEAKAFSDGMFKDYLRKGGPGELYGYGMQAKIYMLALGVEDICYGVKNKNSGAVDVRWFNVDDPSLPTRGAVVGRAVEIYKAVSDEEANVYTQSCDNAMFPCPVFYIHEQAKRVEVQDTVLKDLAVAYKEAQQAEVAAKAKKEAVGLEIAERMSVMGEEEAEVLGWKVTAKTGNSSAVDWATIEVLTGKKKAEFTTSKPHSKATVTITAPSNWTPGQTDLL